MSKLYVFFLYVPPHLHIFSIFVESSYRYDRIYIYIYIYIYTYIYICILYTHTIHHISQKNVYMYICIYVLYISHDFLSSFPFFFSRISRGWYLTFRELCGSGAIPFWKVIQVPWQNLTPQWFSGAGWR